MYCEHGNEVRFPSAGGGVGGNTPDADITAVKERINSNQRAAASLGNQRQSDESASNSDEEAADTADLLMQPLLAYIPCLHNSQRRLNMFVMQH